MTDTMLRQALEYAARGWPVFPCQTGQKTPATAHGYRDATTDPEQITAWFAQGPRLEPGHRHRRPRTRRPGRRRPRPGRERVRRPPPRWPAGLLDGAATYVRTPGGGLHAYFTGSDQRNGHLPGHHLDFRSRGGYVLAPPSQVDGKPYQVIRTLQADGGLDWATVTALLEPRRQIRQPHPHPAPDRDLSHLARWVAGQAEGNRNAGLFWAANRALDADPAADLSPLAAAARQAGLGEREITRTLDSARNSGRTGTTYPTTSPRQVTRHDRTNHPARRPGPGQRRAARGRPRSRDPAAPARRNLPLDRRRSRNLPRRRPAPRCRQQASTARHGHRRPHRDPPGAAPGAGGRGRDPAAAARPARHGPLLGPHRPRRRRPPQDHPQARPRRRPHRQRAAARRRRRPLRGVVGQTRPRPDLLRRRRRLHRPPPRHRRGLVRRRGPR